MEGTEREKTTFLRLLMGQEEYSGEILSSGVQFDYFPFVVEEKERRALEVAEEIFRCSSGTQKELSLLEVDEEILYRPFSSLSNGEQTKLLLAVLFCGIIIFC